MAKVRLTKTELKRQKDALKRFNRYLPTLMLKKQQLQVEILRVQSEQAERRARIESELEAVRSWIGLLGDPAGTRDHEELALETLLEDLRLRVRPGNIAGIDIPLFQDLEVVVAVYDLFTTPLWVDAALEAIAAILKLEAEVIVLEEQQRRLAHELRITSQRVNLFEKIKIPETRESIRRIGIYLGDQQTAAVVRGKISKGKLVGAG